MTTAEGEMMTISEAAREAGLSIYTLRYYERAGLLAPVERDSSGRRRYSLYAGVLAVAPRPGQ